MKKLHQYRAGTRQKLRARNGDGAIQELVKNAFHKWHVRTTGEPYVEYGMRGTIELDAEAHAEA